MIRSHLDCRIKINLNFTIVECGFDQFSTCRIKIKSYFDMSNSALIGLLILNFFSGLCIFAKIKAIFASLMRSLDFLNWF